MCTGLELALIAAGGVGQVMQASEARKQQEAMVSASNQRLDEFLDRNQKREDEAAALFADRQKQAEPEAATAERTAAEADRAAATTQAIDATSVAAPIPVKGSAESVIGGVYDKSASDASTAAKTRAAALAKSSGFGDALFGQELATANSGRKIGTIGEFASSDASMLPYYQDLASGAAAARNRPSGIGSLLAGLGQAGGYYLGSRPPKVG